MEPNLEKILELLRFIEVERVNGIEPSFPFTFFKVCSSNGLWFCKFVFLELFILTFILTSWQA